VNTVLPWGRLFGAGLVLPWKDYLGLPWEDYLELAWCQWKPPCQRENLTIPGWTWPEK